MEGLPSATRVNEGPPNPIRNSYEFVASMEHGTRNPSTGRRACGGRQRCVCTMEGVEVVSGGMQTSAVGRHVSTVFVHGPGPCVLSNKRHRQTDRQTDSPDTADGEGT
jgi:hypothetical protein